MLAAVTVSMPPASAFERAAFYCEENVLRLLASPALAGLPAWALLVSNAVRAVAMRGQAAGRGPAGLVVWDYHVLALAEAGGRLYALDLDTTLGFPLEAQAYVEAAFPRGLSPEEEPRFRLVPSRDYVEGLASDRSHMRRSDGSWLAPPPPWDPPGAGKAPNLLSWIDPEGEGPGQVLGLEELRSFARGRRPAAPAGSRL